jgi:hypothetical protein
MGNFGNEYRLFLETTGRWMKIVGDGSTAEFNLISMKGNLKC